MPLDKTVNTFVYVGGHKEEEEGGGNACVAGKECHENGNWTKGVISCFTSALKADSENLRDLQGTSGIREPARIFLVPLVPMSCPP